MTGHAHDTHGQEGEPVLTVIRQIQNGTLAPSSLDTDARRRCVEHLTGEGYSAVEIAEILRVSDRTIVRDRASIRQDNAVAQDPALTGEMVGHLLQQAETTISRIRRVTRERQTPPASRIDGERVCWMVTKDLVQRLQSLGYLPTAPQEIQGELIHRLDQAPGYDEIQEEVTRLEIILNEDGPADPSHEGLARLGEVKDAITRLSLLDQIKQLSSDITPGSGSEVDDDQERT